MRWISLVLLIARLACSQQSPDVGYSFIVDGKQRNLRSYSLNGYPAVRAAGDVVILGDIPIVLGETGTYRFRTTPEEDGRLFQIDAAGKEIVAGVSIGWGWKGNQKIVFDPLSRLKDEEIRGLRGIRLDSWPEGIEKKLAMIDPARTAFLVTDKVEHNGALPALPDGLRYLLVEESSNSGIKNFSALGSQRLLRFFRAQLMTADQFDVSLLKGCADLRHLAPGTTKLLKVDALATFTELRELDLEWNEELREIDFVRGMKSLASINLSHTGVEDLGPLEGLASLVRVDANQAAVRRLPQEALPALVQLSIMSTKVSDADANAFRRVNPGCKVVHRWATALRDELALASRIRVRSGGTCHRRTSEERTLIDLKDAKEIQAFVRSIVVDESRSGSHCMCCGDPSLEFYAGDKLVATIGFHHGEGLRWLGGWPADGAPTPECADFLVDWLAKKGVAGPKNQREERKRQEAALARRWDRVRAILPPVTWELLTAARSRKDAEKALEGTAEDAVGRAKVLLRLYGSHDGSWNLEAGFDSVVKAGLEKLDGKVLSEAVAGLMEDGEGAMGSAWWILNEKQGGHLTPDVRSKCLPVLARIGLSHSREISRERTLQALVALKDPAAVEPLKEVLAGKLTPRKVKEGDEEEPGGMVSAIPGDPDVPGGVSDVAYAAYALARLGDRSMLKQIRALQARSPAGDIAILDKAIRLLEKDN